MNAIVAINGTAEYETIFPMLARMRHRGEHGTRMYPGENLALGCACSPGSVSAAECSDAGGAFRLVSDSSLTLPPGDATAGSSALLALVSAGDDAALGKLDGGFAFALTDGDRLVVGRDPLGIKPLYWSEVNGTMTFASELKALCGAGAPVCVFPPGCLYDSSQGFRRYHAFQRPAPFEGSEEDAAEDLRRVLDSAVQKNLPASGEAGILLSGGLDSSVLAVLAHRHAGDLHSFSAGTSESDDLGHARALAGMLGLRHHERVFTAADARGALARVIYHLESFDYPLVRSAIANDMASRMAGEHMGSVLCGEGADEIFAGYTHLKDTPEGELNQRLEALVFGCHGTGLQRVDRVNAAHGVTGLLPFLDGRVLNLAFSLPEDMKLHGKDRVEKWIVRHAFSADLPGDIAWRRKRKFSEGSGASGLLTEAAEREVSDRDFAMYRALPNGFTIRNKEEMLYFLIFRECFGDDPSVLDTVAITPSS